MHRRMQSVAVTPVRECTEVCEVSFSPIVSVVMPVYNAAEYREESVNSILGQSLADFEFIIIDDGSTDESPAILDHYQELDCRVRVLHQENRGIGASLNDGVRLARGKYIARMDGDDISLPERLARQVEFMESRPEVGICGTACTYFGDRSGIGWPATESEKIKSKLLFSPVMVHPTVMMRHDLMLDNGLFYRTHFEEGEDYELWYRFSQCCRMANVPEPLVLVRMHRDQKHQRCDEFLDRWGNVVRREAIRALGIEPTDQDIELHQSLCRGNYQGSPDYIKRVEQWLCTLTDANRSSRVLDDGALREVLYEIWFPVCSAASEVGLWTWKTFRKSRVSAGHDIPARSRASFALRCLLKKPRLRP